VEGHRITDERFRVIQRGLIDDRFLGRPLIISLDFGFL